MSFPSWMIKAGARAATNPLFIPNPLTPSSQPPPQPLPPDAATAEQEAAQAKASGQQPYSRTAPGLAQPPVPQGVPNPFQLQPDHTLALGAPFPLNYQIANGHYFDSHGNLWDVYCVEEIASDSPNSTNNDYSVITHVGAISCNDSNVYIQGLTQLRDYVPGDSAQQEPVVQQGSYFAHYGAADYSSGTYHRQPNEIEQIEYDTGVVLPDNGQWDNPPVGCNGANTAYLQCDYQFYSSPFMYVPDVPYNTAGTTVQSAETAVTNALASLNAIVAQEQQDAQCTAGQTGGTPPAPGSNQPVCKAVASDVSQAPPSNVSPPVISGPPIEEHTLTANPGGWNGEGNSYSYQWQRCDQNGNNCSNIGGATKSTYFLVAEDVGSTLRVVVAAQNPYGGSFAQSSQTAVIQRNMTCPTPTASHLPECARPNQWLRGATTIAFKTDDFGADSGYSDRRRQARAGLADLKRAGANMVVLPYFLFIDSDNSSVVRVINANPDVSTKYESTLKDEDVYNAACDARRRGLGNIVLKVQFPSLDPTTFSPTSLSTWQSTYRYWLLHAANLAIRIGAHGLVIGNELTTLTQSAGDNTYWSGLIGAIKRQRDGHILCPHNPSSNARYIVGRRSMSIRTAPTGLTFGVNWDQVQGAATNPGLGFLSQLDYIGVSAYFPLSSLASPSASDIYNGWGHGPYDAGGPTGPYQKLDALYNYFQKKIVFTELGFTACDDPSTTPPRTPVAQPYEDCTVPPGGSGVSQSLKNLAYQETFQSIHDKNPSWLRGVWAWNWGLLIGEEQDRPYGYQLRGNASSDVVCSWYKPSGTCSGLFNTQSSADADLPTCSQVDDTVAATYGNDDVDVEAFCEQLNQPDAESLAPAPSADQSIAGLSDPSNPPPVDATGATSGDPNDAITPVPPDGE